MILSQVTLLCLAALVFGERKYNSDSRLKDCGDECPDNCLCPCSQATGECTEGCVDGYHGYNCTKTCDPHCRENSCQQHNGLCVCVLGYLYRNSRCEADTGERKYNSDSRLKDCGDECPDNCLCPCSQATGECTEGCLAGYYGYNCKKRCDPHCWGNICQQPGGYCACELGYLYRNSRCEVDTGKECKSLQDCHNNRCASTGDEECIEGCKPGWFGYSCDSQCEDNCLCDQESGTCTDCEQGWFGSECQSMCSRGCTEGCYRNGNCVNGCKPGSFGETCESNCSSDCVSRCDQLSGECVECKERRYGPNCQADCSVWCTGCDREGQCIKGCVKGYYGDKCEFICPQHCNGGLCNMNGSCIESTCPSQCYDGLCDLNGTCIGESSCPSQCDGGLCDLNGKCTACKTGFYGPRCSKICEGCVEGGCHKDTGECINRAENGRSWNLYIIGGGVLLILIVLAVFMICCLKRMQGIVHNGLTSIGEAVQLESGLNAPVCSFSNIRSCGSSHASDSTYNHLFAFKPFSVESSFDNLETASGYCNVRLHGGSSVNDGNRSQSGSSLDEGAFDDVQEDGRVKNGSKIVCLQPKTDKENEDECNNTSNFIDIKVIEICKLKNVDDLDAGITDGEKACLKMIEDNEKKKEETKIISLEPKGKEDEVYKRFQKQNIQLKMVDYKSSKMADNQGQGDQNEVRNMACRSLIQWDNKDNDVEMTPEGTIGGIRRFLTEDKENPAYVGGPQMRYPDENIILADKGVRGEKANHDGTKLSMMFEGCQSKDDEEKVAIREDGEDGASGVKLREEEKHLIKNVNDEKKGKMRVSDICQSKLSRQNLQLQAGRNGDDSVGNDTSDVSKIKEEKSAKKYPYVNIIVIKK